MEIINIITLWLHYLATVMWIGGMAFNLLVLRPSMMVLEQSQRPVLGNKVLKRFIIFAWLGIAVLILTGILINYNRMASDNIPSTYGIVLLGKHFVTSIMILVVAWVSFVLSEKLALFAPKPDTILILVKTNLSLGILVLFLTSALRVA